MEADMADQIDQANDHAANEAAVREAAIRAAAAEIPAGSPGDCDLCGEYFSRLVGGACGACRDHYRLG